VSTQLQHKASIAVIVPVFNEQDVLPVLISQLQRLEADEWIVVDGGSSDDTRHILQESPIQWMSAPLGRASQMNAGAKRCDSDILLFIHADTIISSSNISALRQAMQGGFCVGGRFDVSLSGDGAALSVIAWWINFRSRVSGIHTGDQCQFVRRSVFERIGGFPNQALMEDVAFSKRLKREGKVACLRQKVVTSSRRWQKYGLVSTVWLMWKLRFLYWLGISPEKLARMYRQAR